MGSSPVPQTITIININNGCPGVKTAGHSTFTDFFPLKCSQKKCDFIDIIGVDCGHGRNAETEVAHILFVK